MREKNYARRSLENSRRANPGWVDVILTYRSGVWVSAGVVAYIALTLPVMASLVLGAFV